MTAKTPAERQREYRATHRHDPEYRKRRQNWDREYRLRNHGRRMKYKGKYRMVGRTKVGICNLCRSVRGIDCKQTQWHHVQYDDTDKEKHVIELCAKCHRKESMAQQGEERIKEIARLGGLSIPRSQFSEMGKKSVRLRIARRRG